MTSIATQPLHTEDIEVRGHIIDSLILPKILDTITQTGGSFDIKDISIEHHRQDPNFARVSVQTTSKSRLQNILAKVSDHGAVPVIDSDCQTQTADIPGTFPEGFYSTTNQQTEVRCKGRWLTVEHQEMDCGIVLDQSTGRARCVPMTAVAIGDPIVIGHAGVRVFPQERGQSGSGFEFMNSAVSTEKPKGLTIREVAERLFEGRVLGRQNLIVGGPAIVHTGSSDYLCELVKRGYVHRLFAGNALATHDIEKSMFGTSLGVNLEDGRIIESGHEHHLRAINRIRRAGGIRESRWQSKMPDAPAGR